MNLTLKTFKGELSFRGGLWKVEIFVMLLLVVQAL